MALSAAPAVRRSLGILTLVIGAVTTLLMVVSGLTFQRNSTLAESETRRHTESIAKELGRKLSELESAAVDVRQRLSGNAVTSSAIHQSLDYGSLNHDGFAALGVAMDRRTVPLDQDSPVAGPDSGCGGYFCLYAPFIVESRDGVRKDRIDNYYDYNPVSIAGLNQERWYLASQRDSGWSTTFLDPVSGQYVLRYTDRLTDAASNFLGGVFVDIDIDWFREQIENHDLWPDGYAVVISLSGKRPQLLYHSLRSTAFVEERLQPEVPDDAAETGASDPVAGFDYLGEVSDHIVGGPDTARVTNSLTGAKSWLNRAKIGNTDLYLLTIMNFPQVELNQDNSSIYGAEVRNSGGIAKQLAVLANWDAISETGIISLIFCSVFLLVAFYITVKIFPRSGAILMGPLDAAVLSFLFIAGIILIWVVEYSIDVDAVSERRVLANRADVSDFQSSYARHSVDTLLTPPRYVSTGLFVQSIEFVSATDVSLSGYVWQRYPAGQEPAQDKTPIIFPEAISTNIQFSYRNEEQGETVVGWYFETVLNERFDYGYFPFDRQSIWIRLWSREFWSNTVLVPDFESYDSLNPRSLPGLEKNFPLFGWKPEGSYFDVRRNVYNSNFGQADYLNRNGMPELYFNIEVRRNFLNPFISHLFPLTVVLLMLFALMVTIARQHEQADLLGFSVGSTVASCTALFFVVLIAHVQLRGELSANSIVYLESFYFLSYVVILFVTINSILFSWNVNLQFVQYRNNLIPKLIYWPSIFGVLFVLTALTFWV